VGKSESNKTVLVTGGAGYVGSHACLRLAEAGYLPIVFDNLSTGHDWAVQWGPLEIGDLLDERRIADVLERHRPVAVMHFAAAASMSESLTNPLKYFRTNVVGTLNLLRAMQEAGVYRLVQSSSCAVYGRPDTTLICEDTQTAPLSPYGFTKLTCERMAAECELAFGLKSVALRYFNAAGADPEARIGEAHEPETHLIPLVLEAGRSPHAFSVFGDDYDTPDGTAVRDFTHVSDLAEAHLLALEHLLSGDSSLLLNIGTGMGYSVKEVVEATSRVLGSEIVMRPGPRRPGDPARLVADAARARRLLGWHPKYTTIEEIIRDAGQWHARSRILNHELSQTA
jgi:UDP-arabinose 4-epimerase